MRRQSAPASPNPSAVQELTAIRRQAAAWLMRIDALERQISYGEHMRYLRWLAQSPAHLNEMRGLIETRAMLSEICLPDGEPRPKTH